VPRRGKIPARTWTPDPVYNSVLVTRLINKVMYDGKKSLARRLVYDAMDIIRQKTKKDPLEVLEQAIQNAMPVLEVRARRVGGATYQVPVEVRPARRMTLPGPALSGGSRTGWQGKLLMLPTIPGTL